MSPSDGLQKFPFWFMSEKYMQPLYSYYMSDVRPKKFEHVISNFIFWSPKGLLIKKFKCVFIAFDICSEGRTTGLERMINVGQLKTLIFGSLWMASNNKWKLSFIIFVVVGVKLLQNIQSWHRWISMNVNSYYNYY